MLQVKDAESRYDLSSLRLCVSAGEALPEELFKRWGERFGVEILDGIGTTEILHIFLSNRPGPGPSRRHRAAGAGLRGAYRGRRGARGRARRDREPARQGRLDHGLLLEPAREDQEHPLRPVDQHRGQVLRGRGRLLLVLRPGRRHAEGGRHLGLAHRGREHADEPSRRPRGRGGRDRRTSSASSSPRPTSSSRRGRRRGRRSKPRSSST